MTSSIESPRGPSNLASPLPIGFSSCPNDTFMFHALVHGLVPAGGWQFAPVIEDIEALNERALAGADLLPITKLSANVLGRLTDSYGVLRSGAALGRGCGPLVITRRAEPGLHALAGQPVAVPGLHTTAYLLLRMFAPESIEPVPMRFDQIMDAVHRGDVAAGVVIHEGRFTYQAAGLECLADLGDCWEWSTQLPLPLGLICARRTVSPELAGIIEHALRQSIAYARAHPEVSAAYVASMAQELAPDVCARHIDLYVNEFSDELGELGMRAVEALLHRGREAGVLPPAARSPWCD